MKTFAAARGESGIALVTTVIVVAMLAVVAVALMQSTTIDRLSSRTSSNYFRAQFAAQAGVAAAASTINAAINNGRTGRAQWNYISGHTSSGPDGLGAASNAEAESFAFIGQLDPATGGLLNKTFLVSMSSEGGTTEVPISANDSEPAYPAKWVDIEPPSSAASSGPSARYAFWVSDDTTKLNPQVMGSGAARGFRADPSNVRLSLRPSAASRGSATSLPSGALSSFVEQAPIGDKGHWNGLAAIRRAASLFMTPGTFKLAIGNDLVPPQSLENDIAVETLSAPVAPNGRPKINLARLKDFLDSLPKSQSAGNLRYQAVLDVLNASATAGHARWGGGDLSFLLDPAVMGGKYTDQEARRFVANLFDAIDEDFIPTCDDADNPTILGTEIRDTGAGLQGHPYVVYAGTGHFADTPRPPQQLSRIRTHLALGFANPWPVASDPWSKYSVDMQVTPSDPLFPTLTTGTDDSPAPKSPPGLSGGALPPRSGFLFPCANNFQPHYSAKFDFPGSIPQVDDLQFTVNKARLLYSSSDGGTYLVAFVPGSPTLPALPQTVPTGGDGINRFAWQSGRQSYWLKSDPRLHADAAAWMITPNGTGGKGSGIVPAPEQPISYIDSQDEGDGTQGLSGTITTGMTSESTDIWYRSASIVNHLSIDGSLSFDGGSTKISSSGFVGFLGVGKPWQTLTLHAGNTNNPPSREDWKIFDYIYAGDEIRAGNAVLHADMAPRTPYGPEGARSDWPGALSRDGSVNSQHGNWNTWRGLLDGIPGLDTDAVASQLAKGAAQPSSNTFDFLRSVNLAPAATTDFERERVVRYLADSLNNTSRSFTVYAVGEALAPQVGTQSPKVLSRSMVKARLRIDLDQETGGASVRVLQTTSY
jgi:hypothetical protein